jgi:formate dehydrogenase major subunit
MAGGNNDARLTTVRHRAAGATEWEEIGWDDAISMIAQRIKETRDASFTETNEAERTVNRTLAIGSLGSAALDNEECWLYQKFLRALGLVYIEHQARN